MSIKLTAKRNIKDAFVKTGFSNWKKATKTLNKHQALHCHKAALSYEVIVPQCADVRESISSNATLGMEENQKFLIIITESLQFQARQGLELRGADNNKISNFQQLLKLRAKDNPVFSKWLVKRKNTFTSHDIQNESRNRMSHVIIRDYFSKYL